MNLKPERGLQVQGSLEMFNDRVIGAKGSRWSQYWGCGGVELSVNFQVIEGLAKLLKIETSKVTYMQFARSLSAKSIP